MNTPEMATALIALAGAVVGALPGLISGFFARRAEEKRQLRELVIKTTAENWRFIAENSNAVLPFEHYMVHTAMMCDLVFSGKEVTEEAVKTHLSKVGGVMHAMHQHATTMPSKHKSGAPKESSLT